MFWLHHSGSRVIVISGFVYLIVFCSQLVYLVFKLTPDSVYFSLDISLIVYTPSYNSLEYLSALLAHPLV